MKTHIAGNLKSANPSHPRRLIQAHLLRLWLVGVAVLLTLACPSLRAAEAASAASGADLMDLDLTALANVTVSVAGAKEETLLTAASTVTVIDRKMIEDYNFRSVSAAVETLAGMTVWRTYLKQDIPTARGILQENYANKVLVMINNVPTWNSVTGEGELDRINIHDVERIEVMRGPGSVIYGSQAYVGAINLVLRGTAPGTMAGEVHGGVGDNGAWGAGANYRWQTTNGWSVFASINHERGPRRSYPFTDEVGVSGVVDDYLDVEIVTLNLRYKEHSLLFTGFRQDEGYFGVTPRYSGGAGNNHDVDGWMAAYQLNHEWTEKFQTDATAFYDYNHRNLSRAANDSIRANIIGYRTGGNLRNRYQFTDALGFELGGDYEFRKSVEYKNYNTLTDATLTENGLKDVDVYEYSVYGQADWKWRSFQALAGGRYTHNQLFGDDFSPRGLLAYHFNKENVVKLMAGQSFRTPNLFELYFHTVPATVEGNPALKPEKNTTYELLYQYSHGGLYIQPGIYYANYEDKIYRQSIGGGVSRYANGGTFHATGVELEVKYSHPKWLDAFVNFDYVTGSDGDRVPGTDNYNFHFVPDYTVSLGLHKAIKAFDASLVFTTVGAMNGPKAEVDDYNTLDLNLGYTHKIKSVRFRHALAFVNLFDEDVVIPQYVARPSNSVNEMPLGPSRGIYYSLAVSF